MTLDPNEAEASLDHIATIERRTRETLFYSRSGDVFIIWGCLSVIGNLLAWLEPEHALASWIVIDVVGSIATIVLMARRLPHRQRRRIQINWLASYVAFLVYGTLVLAELWPLSGRQIRAFWPTLVMFGYVLMGIWMGRFLAVLGLIGMALILFGHYQLGPWFLPWNALVMGGGLIVGGLWLKRTAA
jgi:hypothetical protein